MSSAAGCSNSFPAWALSHGSVENPELGEPAVLEEPDKANEIDAALQLGAGIFEITDLGDGRFGNQQLPGAARRWRRNVTRLPGVVAAMARMNGRCQDNIADAAFRLDDSAPGHVDCRLKGCGMSF
jgi:hypothetical protein